MVGASEMSNRVKGLVFFLTVLLAPFMIGGVLLSLVLASLDLSLVWFIPYSIVWIWAWSSMSDANWHMHI